MIQKKFYKNDFILKSNRIDWINSENRVFRIEYDNKIYNLTYIGLKNDNYVLVKYNGKEFTITRASLMSGYIGAIIGHTHFGFMYNVDDVVNNRIILKQIKRPKSNNKYEKVYEVKCLEDNYCYKITETMLKNNCECPVCCNRVLVNGINDLWSKRPDIAKMLYNKDEGYKYLPSSKHNTTWICQSCGSLVYKKSIYNVCKNNNVYCPFCNDGFSYPEKLMNAILKNSNIDYVYHFTFENQYFEFKDKPYHPEYDFYFLYNDKKYIIEMDGGFHYTKTNYKYSLEELQEIDKLKDCLANKNDCRIIRIDCRKSNYDYIINSLKNSELANIINFENLDRKKINERAYSSKLKEVCDIYTNVTKCTAEISNITQLKPITIYNYLRSGAQIGLCDYDAQKSHDKDKIPVFCITSKTYYNSMTEASIKTGISISSISACCRGRCVSTKDKNSEILIWMFYTDYQKMITNNIDINYYIENKLNKRWSKTFRKLICLNTLEIFDPRQASQWSGVTKDCIYNCCKGKVKTSGIHPQTGERLRWMYYDEYLRMNAVS